VVIYGSCARLAPPGWVLQSEVTQIDKDDDKSDRGWPMRGATTAWRSLPDLLGGIGWRLLVRVLFFSSVITLLLSLMELYLDYRRDVGAIDQRMTEIDSGYRQSLGDGLWRMDERQLRLQVEGILRLPDIRYVELREASGQAAPLVVTAGSRQANPPVRREFKIVYPNRGAEQLLGVLVVEATYDRVYRRLLDTAAVIMVGQAIKTFIVSFFILLIVHRLITRHLTAMARLLGKYDFRVSQVPLLLDRRPPRSGDELDHLVEAFNQTCTRLQVAYAKERRLVDSNIIGVLIGNPDGHVQEANQAFLRIVGYDQADLAAGRLRRLELTPPEWHDRDDRAVVEMRTTGTVQPFEKEYFRKDGSRVPVLIGGATLDERGDAVVIFVLDLTERKRAEAELTHANRVATMGQLTASIAHEVNNPIAALLVNAETAVRWLDRQPPNSEKAKPLIDRIVSDGKRAADIVRRIRDFSKKAPMRKEDLEINEAILEIMRLTRVAASEHSVSVKTRLSEGLPHIFGDRVQLQQVILNLIMNAIEAMSEVSEGSHELLISSGKADSDGVLITVSDSGPGLPEVNPDRIFEAFYTTKSSGLGMGLSICRSIVEAHGGRLWATPNEPHGAVFCMTLPIGEKSIKSPEPSSV
jgi:PAS domain S-box-containing protein